MALIPMGVAPRATPAFRVPARRVLRPVRRVVRRTAHVAGGLALALVAPAAAVAIRLAAAGHGMPTLQQALDRLAAALFAW